MTLLFIAAALLLAALAVERVRLDRARAGVPLRIVVTGTRGKTTVARLLASVLREDGRTVLAKTTGSEPCLVLPDGIIERIRRRGPASILEQKALLHRAVRLGANVLVAEVMSIHAENHEVEGQRILVPHLVLATNFLVDHTEAQGGTPEEVGRVLALAVPKGATVLVPGGACPASFLSAVTGGGAEISEVPAGTGTLPSADRGTPIGAQVLPTFAENLDLVVAAARRLGVGDDAIRRGIASARHDVGALGIWNAPPHRGR
jgi:gamma-polyglutamate synthase